MNLRSVVIADEHNGIGKENRLLAHLPADLRHFKELTVGFPVIMGRKTFDSIKKPLPGRRNLVVSRQDLEFSGCEVFHSIEEALAAVADCPQVAIVGGAHIYEQTMDLVDTIYLTRIHHIFDADAFFPEIDPLHWVETERKRFEPDDKNGFPYSFITYQRRA